MAAITVRRARPVTAAAMLILASASACGGHVGPAPRPSSATSTSSTPMDLSNVLIQPAGFGPIPNDTTSGPLQTPDDVRRFFTDRPSDPAEILSHGFVAGYVREWQAPPEPVTEREHPHRGTHTPRSRSPVRHPCSRHDRGAVLQARAATLADHQLRGPVPSGRWLRAIPGPRLRHNGELPVRGRLGEPQPAV